MSKADKQKLQEPIKDCPRGRELGNPDGLPCKVKHIGDEALVECLEEDPRACKFSWFIGHFYLCQCPHRVRIAKELEK